MSKYFYDLHIHSCLSPCADDDMTPANIAGMASIQGLTLLALTDHNSSKNCPAFFTACKKYGIVPVPGMELTTSEDIHIICLFPTLDAAMQFDKIVEERLIKVQNNPKIFGNQFVMDENDEIVKEEESLLINATTIDAKEAYEIVASLGGVSYPAHVDRDSGGMIAVLGDIPKEIPYKAYELNDKNSFDEYTRNYPSLKDKKYLVSSDSHHLWTINEAVNEIEINDEPYSSSKVRQELISNLRGE